MRDSNARDVVAPRAALAWAAGVAGLPCRWLYDEADIAAAQRRGEVVRRTEPDDARDRTLLRDVRGPAPLADMIGLATDLDRLRLTLVEIAESAVDALASDDH